MEILGKHYTEKEDAGEMILAACKEMKATEPIPLGSYRGFQMELSFDSFRHDFDITLKGTVSHRVSLGTDARGNIIRLDNALSSIPEKLEKAHEQLTNLQNQQEATRAELGKPFPQEAELAEKVLVWQNWMRLLIWRTPCRSVRKQNRQINLLCWQI